MNFFAGPGGSTKLYFAVYQDEFGISNTKDISQRAGNSNIILLMFQISADIFLSVPLIGDNNVHLSTINYMQTHVTSICC
jgi:hypothetical protein